MPGTTSGPSKYGSTPADPTHSVVNRDLPSARARFPGSLRDAVSDGRDRRLVGVGSRVSNAQGRWRPIRARSDPMHALVLAADVVLRDILEPHLVSVGFRRDTGARPVGDVAARASLPARRPAVDLDGRRAELCGCDARGETTIRLSPTEPRPGQSFTVYVTYARAARSGNTLHADLRRGRYAGGGQLATEPSGSRNAPFSVTGPTRPLHSPPAHLPPRNGWGRCITAGACCWSCRTERTNRPSTSRSALPTKTRLQHKAPPKQPSTPTSAMSSHVRFPRALPPSSTNDQD